MIEKNIGEINIEKIKEDLQHRKIEKVAVLCGGQSSEREVSLNSGKSVFNSLQKSLGDDGFSISLIDVEFSKEGLVDLLSKSIDFAVIMLHGNGGEDGTIQAILSASNIPFTGTGILGSAIAMNKHIAKRLLKAGDIPVLPDILVREGKELSNREINEWMDNNFLSYPLSVKPNSGGSSIGVYKVFEPEDVRSSCKQIWQDGDSAIIEPWFHGRELTLSWLASEALDPIEVILPKSSSNKESSDDPPFYDYHAKYESCDNQYLQPNLSDELLHKLKYYAEKSCKLLQLSVCARVDFILNKRGKLVVLEVNTIPGMTKNSLVPKAAEKIGLSFDSLVLKMIYDSILKK